MPGVNGTINTQSLCSGADILHVNSLDVLTYLYTANMIYFMAIMTEHHHVYKEAT